MLGSHLTALESSATCHSFTPVFKVPLLEQSSGRVESWRSISYQTFREDVELCARHWRRIFIGDGIPPRSVIGMWIGGFTYTDVLHIYGISRAGYIPQLFSLRLPNPEVIYELLEKAGAKALVYESAFEHILGNCPVTTHSVHDDIDAAEETLPDNLNPAAEDIAFIFHTSGSTSGSPKLVPCSFAWLDTVVQKSRQICRPQTPGRQDVTVWMGSMCHIAQTFMFIGTLQHGSCVIQPTAISFSSGELVDMIHRCGLNRLNQFATFLANHLRASRTDAKLLSLLQGLDEILYSGLPLAREEEEWAYRNGLKLRNLFGSTECGGMLLSVGASESGRNPGLLQPLHGFPYRFVSIAPAASTSGYQSTARLMELVIPKESPDCPHVSLRHSDGDFHTGDLFQEAAPGLYTFRGRDDDWIKSENSLRCDTKAIEDNAFAMCGNLIDVCVVVGSGRPSPVMFVEPAVDMDHEKLKKEIIRKTRHFHSRRYLHERITLADMIIVVPKHSLPRTATKGNIRRKAVEDAFKTQLDQIYERVR
ncbi:hypothetical protein Hypma_001208 [Hypsizygus marmoreus]|uniref:AMP-dependent synthetase/ligase domain-containing protein n=1 Tax=Hypsizygus marmoreus TaxID=39966 RepID=A0A369J621_HYPMA|nr:hypothetical protein Hypma_001208 [Hypsizygus marmoreus]